MVPHELNSLVAVKVVECLFLAHGGAVGKHLDEYHQVVKLLSGYCWHIVFFLSMVA